MRFQKVLGGWILMAVVTAAIAGSPPAQQQRFLFNNDGTNLFYRDDLSIDLIARHADECPREVTTYLVCPNGHQKMMYPSAIEELTPRPALQRLVEADKDPFGLFLARLWQRGFEVFISFRLNEVHNVDTPQDPRLSKFWRDHPDFHIDPEANLKNWLAHGLDYSHPEVRDRMLSLIVELMDRYTPDGLELDWMRFPRYLPGDAQAVWDKREVLTSFLASIRKAAQDRPRPILISVRIPDTPAGCRQLGLDVVEWNKRGLIDFATLSVFLSTDFTMPFKEFRDALIEHPIPLYGCIEFGFGGNGRERPHTEATLRAAAMSLHDCGADGVYVFNFPCWRERLPDPPFAWIPQLARPELMKGRPLLIPLVSNFNRMSGIDTPAPLPVNLIPTEVRPFGLHIPALALAADTPVLGATLIIQPANAISVTINERSLAAPQSPREPGADSFTVPVEALSAGLNTIALTNKSSDNVRLERVDLELRYE